MIGSSVDAALARGNLRTLACANAFARSLCAVVKPPAVRDWHTSWAARVGVIESLDLCAQSTSSPANVPSIEWQLPIAATADRSLPTVCQRSSCDGLTKSGRPTPPACSPVRAGYTLLRFWMSFPDG